LETPSSELQKLILDNIYGLHV